MRRAEPVPLTQEQRRQLERYANGRRVAVRLALRARIIVLAADGLENKRIAGVHPKTETDESGTIFSEWKRSPR